MITIGIKLQKQLSKLKAQAKYAFGNLVGSLESPGFSCGIPVRLVKALSSVSGHLKTRHIHSLEY